MASVLDGIARPYEADVPKTTVVAKVNARETLEHFPTFASGPVMQVSRGPRDHLAHVVPWKTPVARAIGKSRRYAARRKTGDRGRNDPFEHHLDRRRCFRSGTSSNQKRATGSTERLALRRHTTRCNHGLQQSSKRRPVTGNRGAPLGHDTIEIVRIIEEGVEGPRIGAK